MTGSNHPRVTEIVLQLRDVPKERSLRLLAELCEGDEELRSEVESLLERDGDPDVSLEDPVPDQVERSGGIGDAGAAGSVPERIGPYEVERLIGRGGMGVVYLARDANLHRHVAIKTLPEELVGDADRLERFAREARLLATLNHASIASIYGLEEVGGRQYIILEYVEGETLADRLARGPLAVDEAIEVARQIAQAVEAAHANGVIHRDLKPANIKFADADGGEVKVLDFGLAKAQTGQPSSATGRLPDSPTAVGGSPTIPGVILGTVGYMSPEQARGKLIDRRTDIWSFGVILYEMLTGKQCFPGDSVPDSLGAILHKEPDWSALPSDTPPTIRLLLHRCLTKDRKRRLNDIADARLEIEDVHSGRLDIVGHIMGTRPAAPTARRLHVPWLMLLLSLLLLVAAVVVATMSTDDERTSPVIRSYVTPPRGTQFVPIHLSAGPPILAPDGRHIAFSAVDQMNQVFLYVRPLDSTEARALPDTIGASHPFWSPDSRSLGFFADAKLKRIEIDGTGSITLADAPDGRGGAWTSRGDILYAPDIRTPIHRIPAGGGAPETVTAIDESRHTTHRWPFALPDGRHFLFIAAQHDATHSANDAAYFASIDGGEPRLVLKTHNNVRYHSNYLLSIRDRALVAQPFDPDSGTLTGDPVHLAREIENDPTAWISVFSASETGLLAFQTLSTSDQNQMVWYDRAGTAIADFGPPAATFEITLSPDDTRVAVGHESPTSLWIYDAASGIPTRLTTPAPGEGHGGATWSPDGNTLIFTSMFRVDGRHVIYRVSALRGGEPEVVLEADQQMLTNAWHEDWLLYHKGDPLIGREPTALHTRSLATGRDIEIVPPQFAMQIAAFSPDGRWIAYMSDESGRFEIYVRPFIVGEDDTRPDAKTRVSTDGGRLPRFREDGSELFFLDADNVVTAASIDGTGQAFKILGRTALFDTRAKEFGLAYDVTGDGQRFLINDRIEQPPAPVTLVTNWTAELRRP